MQIVHTTQIRIVCAFVIGYAKPIECANQADVSFSNNSPPSKIPNTSAKDWIKLDSWGEGISFTISE